ISPDGRLVAFGTDGPSESGTSLWSPSTNERKFWFQGSVVAWFPDSQRAIVSRESDLWSLAVGSTDAKRLTTDGKDKRAIVGSPDGKTIALLGNAKKGFWYEDLQDIWLLDPAKGTERTVKMQIYATDQLHSQPVIWSGDSSHLFFVYHERGDINLWTVAASGGVATRLTNELGTMRGLEADAKGDAFVYVRTTPTSGGEVEYL